MEKLNKDIIINDFEHVIWLLRRAMLKKETVFICLYLIDLNPMSLRYFKKNKPTKSLHKDFYEHTLFYGMNAWWLCFRDVLEESLSEKIRFLEHLIKQLKEEGND